MLVRPYSAVGPRTRYHASTLSTATSSSPQGLPIITPSAPRPELRTRQRPQSALPSSSVSRLSATRQPMPPFLHDPEVHADRVSAFTTLLKAGNESGESIYAEEDIQSSLQGQLMGKRPASTDIIVRHAVLDRLITGNPELLIEPSNMENTQSMYQSQAWIARNRCDSLSVSNDAIGSDMTSNMTSSERGLSTKLVNLFSADETGHPKYLQRGGSSVVSRPADDDSSADDELLRDELSEVTLNSPSKMNSDTGNGDNINQREDVSSSEPKGLAVSEQVGSTTRPKLPQSTSSPPHQPPYRAIPASIYVPNRPRTRQLMTSVDPVNFPMSSLTGHDTGLTAGSRDYSVLPRRGPRVSVGVGTAGHIFRDNLRTTLRRQVLAEYIHRLHDNPHQDKLKNASTLTRYLVDLPGTHGEEAVQSMLKSHVHTLPKPHVIRPRCGIYPRNKHNASPAPTSSSSSPSSEQTDGNHAANVPPLNTLTMLYQEKLRANEAVLIAKPIKEIDTSRTPQSSSQPQQRQQPQEQHPQDPLAAGDENIQPSMSALSQREKILPPIPDASAQALEVSQRVLLSSQLLSAQIAFTSSLPPHLVATALEATHSSTNTTPRSLPPTPRVSTPSGSSARPLASLLPHSPSSASLRPSSSSSSLTDTPRSDTTTPTGLSAFSGFMRQNNPPNQLSGIISGSRPSTPSHQANHTCANTHNNGMTLITSSGRALEVLTALSPRGPRNLTSPKGSMSHSNSNSNRNHHNNTNNTNSSTVSNPTKHQPSDLSLSSVAPVTTSIAPSTPRPPAVATVVGIDLTSDASGDENDDEDEDEDEDDDLSFLGSSTMRGSAIASTLNDDNDDDDLDVVEHNGLLFPGDPAFASSSLGPLDEDANPQSSSSSFTTSSSSSQSSLSGLHFGKMMTGGGATIHVKDKAFKSPMAVLRQMASPRASRSQSRSNLGMSNRTRKHAFRFSGSTVSSDSKIKSSSRTSSPHVDETEIVVPMEDACVRSASIAAAKAIALQSASPAAFVALRHVDRLRARKSGDVGLGRSQRSSEPTGGSDEPTVSSLREPSFMQQATITECLKAKVPVPPHLRPDVLDNVTVVAVKRPPIVTDSDCNPTLSLAKENDIKASSSPSLLPSSPLSRVVNDSDSLSSRVRGSNVIDSPPQSALFLTHEPTPAVTKAIPLPRPDEQSPTQDTLLHQPNVFKRNVTRPSSAFPVTSSQMRLGNKMTPTLNHNHAERHDPPYTTSHTATSSSMISSASASSSTVKPFRSVRPASAHVYAATPGLEGRRPTPRRSPQRTINPSSSSSSYPLKSRGFVMNISQGVITSEGEWRDKAAAERNRLLKELEYDYHRRLRKEEGTDP